MVRAKFKVTSVSPETIRLEAVTSGEGNESWSKWTPSGSLRMCVTNPNAVAFFVEGAEYYLDFTLAGDG